MFEAGGDEEQAEEELLKFPESTIHSPGFLRADAPPYREVSLVSSHDSTARKKEGSQRAAFRRGRSRSNLEWREHHQFLGWWRDRGAQLLKSIYFQSFIAIMILSNAVVIGLETDWPDIAPWDMLEFGFLMVFTTEVALRITCYGPEEYFNFASEDILWNVLDLAIVTFGIVDFLITLASHGSSGGTSLVTLFRLARLLRILRFFHFLIKLRAVFMLAHGMVDAAVSMFWVGLVMFVIMYVCSVVLVRTYGQSSSDDDGADVEFLRLHFGDLVTSMFTLFHLMSTPDLSVYRDHGLLITHPVLITFLVMFVVFGSFGMIALLTGVVCEGLFDKAQLRYEEDRVEQEAKRKVVRERCEEVFRDAQMSFQLVPHEEVAKLVPDLADAVADVGMPITVDEIRQTLFAMEPDENDYIPKDDFIQAVVGLADKGRPVSMAEVHHVTCVVKNKMAKWEPVLNSLSKTQGDVLQTAGDNGRKLKSWVDQYGEAHNEVLWRSQEATGSVNLILQRLADLTEMTQDVADSHHRLDQRMERCEQSLMEMESRSKSTQKSAPKVISSIWEGTGGLSMPPPPAEEPKPKPKPVPDAGKSDSSPAAERPGRVSPGPGRPR